MGKVNKYTINARTCPPHRPAFTLVETMVSFTIFTIVCLGAISLTTFSLNAIENTRTTSQVTKIISNEMEAMRMRGWNDRRITKEDGKEITLYGLLALGTGRRDSDKEPLSRINNDTEEPTGDSTVKTTLVQKKITYATTTYNVLPYAVYGTTDKTGKRASTLESNTTDKNKKTSRFNVTRKVTLRQSKPQEWDIPSTPDVDYAEITVTVNWDDRRGKHKRTLTTYLSKNGLSDYHYRSLQ